MSMGLAPLMTVDEMGGGAESDTTGEETTVNSSPLCEVLSSEETGGGMGWVTGGLIEMSGLPSVARAAAMSSEVIERAWLSMDTGCDDLATRAKGSEA